MTGSTEREGDPADWHDVEDVAGGFLPVTFKGRLMCSLVTVMLIGVVVAAYAHKQLSDDHPVTILGVVLFVGGFLALTAFDFVDKRSRRGDGQR